jgi:hypothetical protein
MNVLVIPEDFRKDQYILKPIIDAMMTSLGRPRAKVVVCKEPLLGGVDEALKWDRIEEIITRYSGMVDLFLLCVDRDGREERKSRLNHAECRAADRLPADRLLLGENAWQELEVWVLAGHDLPSNWSWREIRREVNPKETYFIPFARQRGVQDGPGEGRRFLAIEAARRYDRIRQLCPEDVAVLEERIRRWVDGGVR